MNAIVVGLGSMGRRRARLLHDLDKTIKIIGVDMQDSRRKQAEDELGIVRRLKRHVRNINQIWHLFPPRRYHMQQL